ncbi:murein hydrolase activator EnvC family protein [Thiohalorhabdus sp. Cl-TMA]|uniref:Murein hydrolase activator EnvC n=1 Tax=Thiohalorhabdus methylotrophus TaxID=3242694 RepID=A0ABV4TQZ7_9GAMM
MRFLPTAAVLFLLGALAAPFPAAADSSDSRLEQKKDELAELRRTARDLADRLERTRSRKKGTRQAVFDLEAQVADLRAKRRDNRKALEDNATRLDALTGKRDRLRERVAEHRHRLAVYLQAAHRTGRHGFLRQLFGHEDPGRVRRALTYLGYLHKARRREMARLERTRERLAGVMTELRDEQAEHKRLEEKLARQKRAIAERLDRRRDLLEQLKNKAERQRNRLVAVRSDQKALKKVIARLRRLREDGILLEVGDKHMAELKGKLALPVPAPEVLARFGTEREQRSLRWNGMLLGARPGTEVRAIFRGRVAYADRLRGYGLLTIIDHGDNLLSLYAHNRVLYKEVGEWVETGSAIAAVGSTGGRSRPATYFEIRKDGQPVDPMHWCRSPGADAERSASR